MEERKEKIRAILSDKRIVKGKSISKNDLIPQVNIYPGALVNIVTIVTDSNEVLASGSLRESRLPIEERIGIYTHCDAIAEKYNIYPEMYYEMKKRWNVASMREMNDEELVSLYHLMLKLQEQFMGVS